MFTVMRVCDRHRLIQRQMQGMAVGLALSCAALAPFATADVIGDWDTIGQSTINAPNLPAAGGFPAVTPEEIRPNTQADLATLHVAMYDAVIAIAGGFKPYAIKPVAPTAGASQEAAAGGAACGVLQALFPNRAPKYAAACAPYLATSPGAPAVLKGIAVGIEVAHGIVALRANDGRLNTLVYVPDGTPGNFIPSSPALVGLNAQFIRPFAVKSVAQFRAPPPPALNSERYEQDFNLTKELGSATSTTRTPEQSEIARFHTDTPGLGRNLRRFSNDTRSIAANARLMAMIFVAQADVASTCFESKYHYARWRPRTAIPAADTDGNDETIADPTWLPFLPTPNHPEYPAAHSCVYSALAGSLRGFFHTSHVHFDLDSNAFLAIDGTVHVHHFDSLPQLLAEARLARIAGGMHFRTSTLRGIQLGTRVSHYVNAHYFRPVKHEDDDDDGDDRD